MKLIIFSLLGISFLHSCGKVQGCTNEKADNYNIKAEKDNGSCILGRAKFITSGGWNISGTIQTNNQNNSFVNQTCKITSIQNDDAGVNITLTINNISPIELVGSANSDTLKVINHNNFGIIYNGTLIKKTGDANIYINLNGTSTTNTTIITAQGPTK